MIIKVDITGEMKKTAKSYSDSVLKNLKKTPNYTGLSVENRFYCGYLGEQVFNNYLKESKKRFEYQTRFDGNSDNGDYLLFMKSGVVRTADAKTACKKFHSKIMMPFKQAKIHSYYYYIGVKLNEDVGEIWGYCLLEDFVTKAGGFDNSAVDTLYKDLSSLRSIEELLNEIESL